MLTRKKFMDLWENLQEEEESFVRDASITAELANAYAKELATLTIKDVNGNAVKTLKWEEIPLLYRQELLKAFLVEYGWNAAMEMTAPHNTETQPADEKKKASSEQSLYQFPFYRLKCTEAKDFQPHRDMLRNVLNDEWQVFAKMPLSRDAAAVFEFVVDRIVRKTQWEGFEDYSSFESRRVIITIYEIMERLGIKNFQEAKAVAEKAAVEFGHIYIKHRDTEEAQTNAFSYAAGSASILETGINDCMAQAFEESWCRKEGEK